MAHMYSYRLLFHHVQGLVDDQKFTRAKHHPVDTVHRTTVQKISGARLQQWSSISTLCCEKCSAKRKSPSPKDWFYLWLVHQRNSNISHHQHQTWKPTSSPKRSSSAPFCWVCRCNPRMIQDGLFITGSPSRCSNFFGSEIRVPLNQPKSMGESSFYQCYPSENRHVKAMQPISRQSHVCRSCLVIRIRTLTSAPCSMALFKIFKR